MAMIFSNATLMSTIYTLNQVARKKKKVAAKGT